MGLTKRMLEEMESREFGAVEKKNVCIDCFRDIGLKKFIKKRATSGICAYCAEKSVSVVPLEAILSHIQSSLRTEYPTPEDAGVPFQSREGGWLIEPIDVIDIFAHEPIEETNEVIDDIIKYLGENIYTPKIYKDEDQMSEMWYNFTSHIKHKSRFLFDEGTNDYEGHEWRNSKKIPHEICKIILDKNLFIIISAGEKLLRVRLSDNINEQHNAKSLGTAPLEKAIYENRMSPAGIPVFYGSKDLKTAILEVHEGIKNIYHSAIFKVSRDVVLVDLTNTIKVPSIYDEDDRKQRSNNIFINEFIRSISKPIKKDEKQKLSYLPTQIITEFLRYKLKKQGSTVDGIMYKSAAQGGGISCVLFVENSHCVEKTYTISSDELYLVCQSIESGLISDIL